MADSAHDTSEVREKVVFDDNGVSQQLFGPGDRNLKTLRSALGVRINRRGNEVSVIGAREQVELATSLLGQLYALVRRGRLRR